MTDWRDRLTEEERHWADIAAACEFPDAADAIILKLARSLSASRRQVEAKDAGLREAKLFMKVMFGRGVHWCSNESEQEEAVLSALAFTEEDGHED